MKSFRVLSFSLNLSSFMIDLMFDGICLALKGSTYSFGKQINHFWYRVISILAIEFCW